MVRIGIAGIGFMGVTHYNAIRKVKGARVTAIFTRSPKKLRGDWRDVQGNFGDGGGVQDLSAIRCHGSLEELLHDDQVDVVHNCLPTPLHLSSTMAALGAGKHVFLEKPIAVSLHDADLMLAEARRQRRLFMVAHVLRFFPEFRLIKELAAGRRFGAVRAAHFKRVTAYPKWRDADDIVESGGPAIDLHIHDCDFVRFLFGNPQAVTSNGLVSRRGIVEHVHTHYHFAGRPMAISSESGWLSQQGCPFEHGYDVYFADATLKFNSTWGRPPVLLTADGKTRQPRLPGRKDAFIGEIQDAVDALSKGKTSPTLSALSGRESLRLCLKEIESVRRQKKVNLKK
jgi:predicted dehydrogenase